MDQPGDARRSPLTIAAVLLAVEGVGLVLAGGGFAISAAVADAEDPLATVLGGLMAAGVGAFLLAVARAVRDARGWSRAPAVLWQLLSLAVAYNVVKAGVWWVGVPLLLVAAGVLYQLATPDARLAFADERGE